MNTTFYWIPEAPTHPGLYSNQSDRGDGKLVLKPPLATYNIDYARRFDTKDACREWCEANPDPKFVPMEHGFYGPEEGIIS